MAFRSMTHLLQFCGVSEPLQVFDLEQSLGPVFAGFRRSGGYPSGRAGGLDGAAL